MQNNLMVKREAGGLSATALKMIAMAAMLVDHAAFAFVPDYYGALGVVLHFVGRITAPIMFYFLVEGYHHTRNKNRYTLRLAIFAVVSYLPFVYFRSGTMLGQWPQAGAFVSQSVIYTLLLALLALRARHELASPIVKVLAIAGLLLFSVIGDWGWLAIVFVLLFDVLRGDFKRQAWAYTLVVFTQLLPNIFKVIGALAAGQGAQPNLAVAFVQCGMFVPLALLGLYNGQRGGKTGKGKWFFYWFYPLHLLLLVALKTLETHFAGLA